MQRIGRGIVGVAGLAALAGTGACETWGTVGIPEVVAVVLAVEPTSLAVGERATVRGAALDGRGRPITHPRRAPLLSARDTAVAVVGRGDVNVAVLGVVVARGVGSTWILAESGGRRDSVRVTVRATAASPGGQ